MMFIDIFNDLLDEKNLNRKQFSAQSGITYTTVIGWTNLNRLPDYHALIKISDFFQCSIDYLFGRQEEFLYISSPSTLSKQEQQLLSDFRKLTWREERLKKHPYFGQFSSKNRSKYAIFEGRKNLCDNVRQAKFALFNYNLAL